mmetsp:Transcript_13934/g.25224  ORF Transcript_13934/g.25224 Transcript_13934/m.25224 type:complete len:99 (-) Transcript_13934:1039-1335(-)
MEDAIQAHVTAIDATLDAELLDVVMRDHLEYSKFVITMGSTTIDGSGCELFESTLANIRSTIARRPNGVTAEMLLKMWTNNNKMAAYTGCDNSAYHWK